MPKEIVQSKYPDEPGLLVQVGWGREAEYVQISTVNGADGAVLQPSPEGNGWYVQLDRPGINALIRILRKARDQSYGRDE